MTTVQARAFFRAHYLTYTRIAARNGKRYINTPRHRGQAYSTFRAALSTLRAWDRSVRHSAPGLRTMWDCWRDHAYLPTLRDSGDDESRALGDKP